MDLKDKLDKVKEILKDKKVAVAFSGGADSTLLAKLVKDSSTDAVALTVDNGVVPSDLTHKAVKIAKEIGIRHVILKENFSDDQLFRSNPPQRCYVCKNKMYNILLNYVKENGYDELVEGTNISDLLEDRPGILAVYQKKISTPLVYGGLTSKEVRSLLKEYKIEYSPSTTCYATRIPYETEINTVRIRRIERAEKLIINLTGIETVRVRDESDQARLEVFDINQLLNKEVLAKISEELVSMGFKKVLLDITNLNNSNNGMVIFKPCRDEANKIMVETALPYQVNIPETCQEMEKLGKVKCSSQMGVAMMELDEGNVTIFKKGKIVARRVKDKESAQKLLNKILPLIRRVI